MFSKTTVNSLTIFFKTFSLKKMLLFFLNPLMLICSEYYQMFFVLLLIVFIDLRFGIKVYCKDKGKILKIKKPSTWSLLTSSGFRKTFNKIKDYIFLIFAIFLLDKYMLNIGVLFFNYTLTHLSFIVLSGVELWSIGENFKKIRGYNFLELLHKIIVKKSLNDAIENLKETSKNK
jgi:hypothetical protein